MVGGYWEGGRWERGWRGAWRGRIEVGLGGGAHLREVLIDAGRLFWFRRPDELVLAVLRVVRGCAVWHADLVVGADHRLLVRVLRVDQYHVGVLLLGRLGRLLLLL